MLDWTRINETRHTATGTRADRYFIDRPRIGTPWTARRYSVTLRDNTGRVRQFATVSEAKSACEGEDRLR